MAQRTYGELEGGDIAVVVLYFAGTIAVGCWSIWRSKSELSGYFLAGRSMTWWPIGMSMFASNIGSVNYMGIAGSAAASGYAVVMFDINYYFILYMLMFLRLYDYFVLRWMKRNLHKDIPPPLHLHLKFTTSQRNHAGTDLFSGALFIKQTLGLNIYIGVAILLAISVVFTAFGGLQTVILTDAVAVVVMILGGVVLSIIGMIKIGGLTNLEYKYMRAIPNTTQANSTCGRPPDNALHIFRSIDDPTYPWLGTVLRTTLGSLWYWCANQVLVQRALAAKDINHARGGSILAGYLKLLPMFLMIFPGMISRVLFPDEVACTDPNVCKQVCDTEAGCTNIALPKLVTELLPEGLRGLLVAAMIAAVISSLTSVFNSASALFTIDIWIKIRPHATNRERLFVGKSFVVVLTAVSIIWIPIMQDAQGGQIFVYATTVTGYLAAPTCAMFVLAVFWKRVNEPIAGLTFNHRHINVAGVQPLDQKEGQLEGQTESLKIERIISEEDDVSDDDVSFLGRMQMLKQTPAMSRFVNANAVAVMTLTAFVYGWWH
ncbi:hypothetical protein CAPTEDRAFT_176039 [Capitella teleta]|uniref:Uncharacterized protein n=1 Tax=Capitella teleta TaxID=283909 RepID=R7UGY0_CAPTE|nr:hypothetical protein CAPTEDRAFT_176039 [Capitella teleta]|eukprot:ELU05465.1 hypothetical protein CAPTEDRAFT_176039 [Capitella teleta]